MSYIKILTQLKIYQKIKITQLGPVTIATCNNVKHNVCCRVLKLMKQ